VSRLRALVRHPFWQAIGLVLAAYLLFTAGIAYLPGLFGLRSAPAPRSVVLQYMLTALVGILIYVSHDEDRWRQFKEPITALLVLPGTRVLRGALLTLVPLLIGWLTFQQVRPKVDTPVQLRSIHPAPPGRITFRGSQLELTVLENPLRHRGTLEEHYEVGRGIYYQNCLPCHGDLLDGNGHYGHGFSPTPLSFTDPGTIAQLTESFVFWRIAKGGPGLPREGAPWNSAMPAWEDYLTENEIWAVIVFLYEQTGWQPRRWEEGGGEEGEGH
jgi:hypothetical protein